MMKRYRKTFTSVIYGFYEVAAENPEEAEKLFESGEYDQFDNKSEIIEEGDWEE